MKSTAKASHPHIPANDAAAVGYLFPEEDEYSLHLAQCSLSLVEHLAYEANKDITLSMEDLGSFLGLIRSQIKQAQARSRWGKYLNTATPPSPTCASPRT